MVDVNDGLGKGLRIFLGQVVSDSPDGPVRISGPRISWRTTAVPVRCTIGIISRVIVGTLMDRAFGEPLFQAVIFWLAFS
jgi:hypothetical protein